MLICCCCVCVLHFPWFRCFNLLEVEVFQYVYKAGRVGEELCNAVAAALGGLVVRRRVGIAAQVYPGHMG